MSPAGFTPSWWKGDPASTGDHDPLEKAVLWSTYFQRFFGPVKSGSDVPTGLKPMSYDECFDVLSTIHETSGPACPHPEMLKRCLCQMVYAGYQPGKRHAAAFPALAKAALRDSHPRVKRDESHLVRTLLQDARLHYGLSRGRPAQVAPFEGPIRVADTLQEHVISQPTTISHDGEVWTVKTEFLMQSPVKGAQHLVNPENWKELGTFFKEIYRVDDRQRRVRPSPR